MTHAGPNTTYIWSIIHTWSSGRSLYKDLRSGRFIIIGPDLTPPSEPDNTPFYWINPSLPIYLTPPGKHTPECFSLPVTTHDDHAAYLCLNATQALLIAATTHAPIQIKHHHTLIVRDKGRS